MRAWIAILTLALLTTTVQAKLGWHRSGKSRGQLIRKEFKPAEGRSERIQALSVSLSIVAVVTCQVRPAEPRSPEPAVLSEIGEERPIGGYKLRVGVI